MKRIILLSLLFLMAFVANSCEKDEFLTDRDKTEAELIAFVESNDITTCYVHEFYNNTLITEYTDIEFSIENGFFIVHLYDGPTLFKIYYNLSFLYRYYIGYSNTFHIEFYKN